MHRRDRRVHVAVALDDVGAQECLGVVLHLLGQGFVGLAEFEDHMGRSGVGSGSHGGDVGRLQQEESGRPGAGARRSHINDDGNSRGQDGAGHLTHRVDQAAGGVEFDQQGRRAFGVGARDGAVKLAGGHGLDGVVKNEFFHHAAAGRRTTDDSPITTANAPANSTAILVNLRTI